MPNADANPKKKSERSKIADLFASQSRMNRLPEFTREHPFAKNVGRNWRFDFCWNLAPGTYGLKRPIRLAVEIEGIVMRRVEIGEKLEWIMGGRHATIAGFKEDCIKYSTAALLGWTVLRFEQSQVKKKFAIAMTMRVLHRMGYRAA